MSWPPLRLVHSSDWHLERPVGGLADVPEHLRAKLIDAPYRAASRVVDTAIAEEVDCLVLSGDILHVERAGPRGVAFLVRQFERLEAKQIKVYWAGGSIDPPDGWPRAIRLPNNVARFSGVAAEALTHQRDGVPVARVIGCSRSPGATTSIDEFYATGPAVPSIAVLHAAVDAQAVARRGIVYWALGSRHGRQSVKHASCLVHYPGTQQGRDSREPGPHGCTLVELDGEESIHTTFVPTDAVRWEHAGISINELADSDVVAQALREHAERLRHDAAGINLLVCWTLTGTGPLVGPLRHTALSADLLQGLRDEFGPDGQSLWSASLELEPAAAWPDSLAEQDTFLGEFLREVAQMGRERQQPIDFADDLDEASWLGPLNTMQRVDDVAARQRLLRNVAELGIDLLSGEGVPQ